MKANLATKSTTEDYLDSDYDGMLDDSDEKQKELFDEELTELANLIQASSPSDKFEIKVVVSLKPCRDNALPTLLPVARGKLAARYVEEMIELQLRGKYFKDRLRSVVGKPSGQLTDCLEKLEEQKKQR